MQGRKMPLPKRSKDFLSGDPAIRLDISIQIPDPLFYPALRIVLLYRTLRTGRPYRKIPLTKNKFALVDPEDYLRLAKYKWHASQSRTTWYARRYARCPRTGRQITVKMHRAILNLPDSLFVDHINGNGLDNRKANLRPATRSQNACNIPKYKPSRSKYKGITWHKARRKWAARIRKERISYSLGYFNSQTAAAKAYDKAAKTLHKQFANCNFPH